MVVGICRSQCRRKGGYVCEGPAVSSIDIGRHAPRPAVTDLHSPEQSVGTGQSSLVDKGLLRIVVNRTRREGNLVTSREGTRARVNARNDREIDRLAGVER